MDELGVEATIAAIATHYRGLIGGLVIDAGDVTEVKAIDLPVRAVPTLMVDGASKMRLARDVLAFGDALKSSAEWFNFHIDILKSSCSSAIGLLLLGGHGRELGHYRLIVDIFGE